MQKSKSFHIKNEAAWSQVVLDIWAFTSSYHNWQLHGEMGAGKTTFVKALCSEWGFEEANSPTFSIINEYPITHPDFPYRKLCHIDLYRLEPEELLEIGFEEYLLLKDVLTIVEWPDVASDFWWPPYARLQLSEEVNHERELMIILNP